MKTKIMMNITLLTTAVKTVAATMSWGPIAVTLWNGSQCQHILSSQSSNNAGHSEVSHIDWLNNPHFIDEAAEVQKSHLSQETSSSRCMHVLPFLSYMSLSQVWMSWKGYQRGLHTLQLIVASPGFTAQLNVLLILN
jgi:hypothetical protein